jgi:hypothetical protein
MPCSRHPYVMPHVTYHDDIMYHMGRMQRDPVLTV